MYPVVTLKSYLIALLFYLVLFIWLMDMILIVLSSQRFNVWVGFVILVIGFSFSVGLAGMLFGIPLHLSMGGKLEQWVDLARAALHGLAYMATLPSVQEQLNFSLEWFRGVTFLIWIIITNLFASFMGAILQRRSFQQDEPGERSPKGSSAT